MRGNNQGATLVELLVGIAIGSLVTLAATTVILMGLRLNRQSMDVSSRHNTARVLLNSLEDLATDGTISGFSMEKDRWQIYGKEGTAGVLYSYDKETKTISTGGTTLTNEELIQNGTPIMKNVESSYLAYDDGLLTISGETEDGVVSSTVYCRIMNDFSGSNDSKDEMDETVTDETIKNEAEEDLDANGLSNDREKAARIAFVTVLFDEYRDEPKNIGKILRNGVNQDKFYAQWYIGDGNWGKNGWDEFTPWCACFVSWAIAEVEDATKYDADNIRPSYAGVDSFLKYFYVKDLEQGENGQRDYWISADEVTATNVASTIFPGDVIFFDWVVDNVRNPQHVGVVLGTGTENVDGVNVTYVYTIEGNVAASYTDPNGRYGTVGLRKYELSDRRILGYGVLDWQTGDLPSTPPEGNE